MLTQARRGFIFASTSAVCQTIGYLRLEEAAAWVAHVEILLDQMIKPGHSRPIADLRNWQPQQARALHNFARRMCRHPARDRRLQLGTPRTAVLHEEQRLVLAPIRPLDQHTEVVPLLSRNDHEANPSVLGAFDGWHIDTAATPMRPARDRVERHWVHILGENERFEGRDVEQLA